MRRSKNSKDPRLRWITVLDLVIVLDNVFRAAGDPNIGFEDSRETLKVFTSRMNKPVRVYTEDLESALWSCNLLSEKSRFRHPSGLTFDEFLRRALRGDSFNKEYNYIEGEKGSRL